MLKELMDTDEVKSKEKQEMKKQLVNHVIQLKKGKGECS